MTTSPTTTPEPMRLERTYDASRELVWELLTSPAGIAEWWSPAGFETRVTELDVRPGGTVRYTMTATATEQVAFVENLGLPLSNTFERTYTEVVRPTRLAYASVINFVPDHDPYEHLTMIDLDAAGPCTTLAMVLEPLHDETWSQEYREHRENELENLARAIIRRGR